MAIGDRINELRIKKAVSLQQVADAVGASKAHIWELETNKSKNPSIDLLQKLAGYFGTSVAFLIEEEIGELDKADQFFRKNSQKLASLEDSDFEFIEQLLDRLKK